MTQPALPDPARTGPRPGLAACHRLPEARRPVAGFHPPQPGFVVLGRGPAARSAVDDGTGSRAIPSEAGDSGVTSGRSPCHTVVSGPSPTSPSARGRTGPVLDQ